MAEYPNRGTHWAHKLVRLMLRSCAAQEIGCDGFTLVTAIAHTEDSKRYCGAVTFWNEQLLPILGFNSWGQLDRARERAVEAGWLHYESGGKRKVGRYWTTIPADLIDTTDTDVSCDYHDSIAKNGDKDVEEPRENRGTTGGEVVIEPRENRGTSGEHSYLTLRPNPDPIPNSLTHTPARLVAVEVSEAIETWHEYWRTSHGCGRPDSDVRVDAMMHRAMSAGWGPSVIVAAIQFGIAKSAKSWLDPEADFEKLAKAKANGRKQLVPESERC